MANGKKVCAGFAEFSPAHRTAKGGKSVVPGTAHPSPEAAKAGQSPRGHSNRKRWCQCGAIPSSSPVVLSFLGG